MEKTTIKREDCYQKKAGCEDRGPLSEKETIVRRGARYQWRRLLLKANIVIKSEGCNEERNPLSEKGAVIRRDARYQKATIIKRDDRPQK